MIVEITPIAITNIGYKFYVMLAIFNVCSSLVVYFFYPETAKLSLEEIDFYFIRRYGTEADIMELETVVEGPKGGRGKQWVETVQANRVE